MNEKGKGWTNQLTQNHWRFDEFEKRYKNDPWWREMKERMKNKTRKEIELDRRLFEEVGMSRDINDCNLKDVSKLISMGAQLDHWIEYGGTLYNVITSAAIRESDNATLTVKLLLEKFPKYLNTDRGGFDESPLRLSMLHHWSQMPLQMMKMIIQTKTVVNPIYTFLIGSDAVHWSIDGKLGMLETIDTFYDLRIIIPADIKQFSECQDNNHCVEDDMQKKNLMVLYEFCGQKGKLKNVFGKSYSINSPLGWRFKIQHHFKWVAQEMVHRNFNGRCSIKNMGNHFKVPK